MATKILLKKSVTGGASPLTSDLDQGELAINLVDQKIYTKDNGNDIVEITGAYVDSVAPANPTEGDIWYDTVANQLKAYDGSAFQAAGYQTVSALEDVTLTSIASGDHLTWNGTAFVNSNLESDVEGFFSVVDAGGDGSLTYANGVHTYTGPSAAEARAHFTGGTGVSIVAGEVAIGQPVATTSDVEFNKVTTSLIEGGSTITIDPAGLGDNTGTVVIAGDLTVNGTTTSVNSNEVNIGDSIILLNSDEAGTPSQDGGIEIERGTQANKSFVWNEADGKWDLAGEELQNVILDGGSY
jgi:hypothetical protein